MAKSLDELVRDRPVDRAQVDAHKRRMLEAVRAYRLRELREASGLTQVELAASASRSRDPNRLLSMPTRSMAVGVPLGSGFVLRRRHALLNLG